jgi:hypothetical protein
MNLVLLRSHFLKFLIKNPRFNLNQKLRQPLLSNPQMLLLRELFFLNLP